MILSYYWYPFPPPPHAVPPPRGVVLSGGIVGLVASSIYLFGSGFVLVVGVFLARVFDAESSMRSLLMACLSFLFGSCLGIVAGAFSCALRPTWTLISGSVHVLFAGGFLYLAYGPDREAPWLLVCVLLSGVAAALSFVGYPQAKRYQEWRSTQRRDAV